LSLALSDPTTPDKAFRSDLVCRDTENAGGDINEEDENEEDNVDDEYSDVDGVGPET
jgi:hypothetical protein